jgi:hypothetical protein
MKYGIIFLILGLAVGLQSLQVEQVWALGVLCWLSATFIIVSLAYLFGLTWIFGKRSDGRIRVASLLLLLPYHLLNRTIWLLSSLLGREDPWNQVDDKLIIGRLLRSAEAPEAAGFTIDLTCECALLRSTEYMCCPILDAMSPQNSTLIEALKASINSQSTTYIHCAQGHGRTGMAAILWLALKTGERDYAALLNQVKASRPGVGLSRPQETWVKSALEGLASDAAEANHEPDW